jgi:hypothetical protein
VSLVFSALRKHIQQPGLHCGGHSELSRGCVYCAVSTSLSSPSCDGHATPARRQSQPSYGFRRTTQLKLSAYAHHEVSAFGVNLGRDMDAALALSPR